MNTIPANRKRKIRRRILVGLLLTVCVVAISFGFLLKDGIRVESLTVGQMTLSNLFLQWRDKLEVQIDTVTINEKEKAGTLNRFRFIDNGVRVAGFLGNFFSRVTVNLNMGDLTGTLHLDSGSNSSYFTLNSNDLVFQSNLVLKENSLVAEVKELSSRRFNSRATGQIRFNGGEKHITGTLSAELAGVLPVTVDFIADQQQVSFKVEEAGLIKDITPLVDLFGLDKNIQRWITEYLKASLYTLKTFEGTIPWHDPGAILDTLYAEVGIEDFEYVFAPGDPGLDPVKADYTDVVFNKKVLTITPHESIFYDQGVGDSRVEIDFGNLTNIILTLYIKTHARANDDILALLSYYNIDLPLKQTAGNTETDFTLTINLNKQQVESKGTFLIDKGIVEFDGKKYGVTDTRIELDNNIITIDGVAGFEKLFVAGISGTVEIKGGVGTLDITLERISLDAGKSKVTLAESGSRPVIKYHIRPDGQSIDVSSSSWNLDSLQFNLGAFSSPFSQKDLSINLPPTLMTIPSGISSKISGFFSIKERKVDFHCDLLRYQISDLVLESSSVPISIQYDQELTIRTEKISHWKMNNISTILHPSEFKYADNVLSILSGRLSYGDFFDSRISGQFSSLSKRGSFLLEDLHIKENNIGDLFGSPNGFSVKVSDKEDRLVIKVPELDLMISTNENRSTLRLEHAQGSIDFDFEGDNFSLQGENLNNKFMAALVQGANFTGGRMSVAVKGTSDTFSALFKIENTILKEFKALNNILAFINTIPALITFSLPEYSSRGLPINSVVVGMFVEEGLATLESFNLESPEISMTGSGWINFPQNRIDMDLNLITQAKKNIKKIPLAGYILAGDEKRPSITVKISGDLQNPKVENSTMKEVVTLPFAILLRTLALPLHLVGSMIDSTENRQDEK